VRLCFLLLVIFQISCGSESNKDSSLQTKASPPVSQQVGSQPEASRETAASTEINIGAAGPSGGSAVPQVVESGEVSAANVKSIQFSPERPIAGEPIKVQIAFGEPDVGEIPLRYRWKVNNEAVQESNSNSLAFQTKRGDRIEVAVFGGAFQDEIRAIRANIVVENAPPAIKKVEDHLAVNGEYIARLEASDPDGDPVVLNLQQGPKGMSLDGGRNELRWTVPEGTAGSFPVEVVATDPAGATTVFSYVVTIRQVQPSAGSAANATSSSTPSR